MKNTPHTPGPWNLNGNGILLHPVTNAQLVTQRIETSLGSFEVLDETNEPEANAYLISAAPDLLSALEGFIELYLQGQLILEGDNGSDPLILKAIHTLRKAKGVA
jgi:hypothetical protein